jgi:hypothetical protein
MLRRIRLIACACSILEIAVCSALANPPLRNRRAFAEAMSKVHEGMSHAEIIALVGKPDDVTTQRDWQVAFADVREIWRYGAAGPMQVATLGQIEINGAGRVAQVFGQGAPPPDGMFTEPELTTLLQVLYHLNELHDLRRAYNPRLIIRAVNMLQPLGKERALAAVAEYVRVSNEDTDFHASESLILVLRTLFEVPTVPTTFYENDKPQLPGVMLPHSDRSEPSVAKQLPRLPIMIAGDIPFFLDGRANFASGPGPQPLMHVDYFRKYGTIRAKPLAPTNKPMAAIERLIESPPLWKPQMGTDHKIGEMERGLYDQALRFLDTVDRREPDEDLGYLKYCCCANAKEEKALEVENRKIVDEASKLAVRWDAEKSLYTRLDGTFIPPFDETLHPLLTWRPAVPEFKGELLIKRLNRWYIELTDSSNEPSPINRTRVFDLKIKDKPLAAEIDGFPWGGRIRVDEGHEIQLELTAGEKTYGSPVFKP